MRNILGIGIGIIMLVVVLPLIATLVTPENDNLFNKNSIDSGYSLTVSGNLAVNALTSTSAYIEIDSSLFYIIGGFDGDITIALYDDNYSYISSSSYTSATTADVLSTTATQYIKITCPISDTDTVQINEGWDLLPYSEHVEAIDTSAFKLLKLVPIIIMGGSITYLVYYFKFKN